MTIPGKKRVPVTLDRERHLVLDLAAFVIAEEMYGGPLMQDMKTALTSFKGIHAFLFAGLKRDDPTLTIDQFNDLMSLEAMQSIVQQLPALLESAMPQESDVPLVAEVPVGVV